MSSANRILIVDDDVEICNLLQKFLTQHGYKVLMANNGRQMQHLLSINKVDLIVLDIMMPGSDGLELCRKLRTKSGIPIIMLSAMGDEADRVVGLEVGADDYLPKPFSPRELLARIKALLRRVHGELPTAAQIKFDAWTLDRNKRHLISPDGLTIPLSAGEFDLLVAFIEHAGRTLNRDQLMDLTRGREADPFDRTIDVQVGRLRKKIEKDPKNPELVITVRGGGYRFTPKVEKY
ncbi:MAG: response regulator [Gammaproteobacteria bacterium]|nr:response regulator [Gammaproteobacteria bacterium]